MKKALGIFLLLLVYSCQSPPVKEPLWLNPTEEWAEQDEPLKFQVGDGEWKVKIQTSSQPILTDFTISKGELTIPYPTEKTVVEGMAFILLEQMEASFSYPITLKVDSGNGKLEDIRSPKTINTDSSLVQQQLLYRFGKGGNLVPNDSGFVFQENYLQQTPTTGTFSGDSDTQLSSFYIAAGTPSSIPLSIQYDEVENKYRVQAGPLQDIYENQTPNGTLLTFSIKIDEKTWIIEEVSREGYVRLHLDASKFSGGLIQANIAQVFSETLQLKQP